MFRKFAPPGTPAETVKILRDAFIATMQDKDFLTEADRLQLSVSALDGAKVQDVVTKVYASPPAVVARAKELIKD